MGSVTSNRRRTCGTVNAGGWAGEAVEVVPVAVLFLQQGQDQQLAAATLQLTREVSRLHMSAAYISRADPRVNPRKRAPMRLS